MSELSLAYIFHHQQLLVDQNLQLPKVEKLASDLLFTHDEQVIARDLLAEEPIPEGLQLVPIRQLITSWSKEQFLQASRAVQLLEWRRNHKFCSHCGHPTEVHPTEYAMVCPSCRYHQYPRVNPCIITVITRGDDEILLAKSVHNKTNMYGLIAGFVEVGETLEEAVQREAFEEVGLKLKNIQYMSSQPWPFPSNLMVAFRAEYESGEIKLQEEEIADAQFFKINQLPEIPFKGSIAHSMIMQITQAG
ncbi:MULTISPECIES: NAD(+) diphosphatase [Acinetobacter]|jgi:NAD+ diphosphatase|uniref:NAD(+) diphosphatase n=1 Tax=Acinetobacter TaxID=469 RepID=UPI000837B479|nr:MULTISPECIES: NAD(+) diphosphatase [Acinetobacter]AXJ90745.1 NAD(+) diphosphatase [Acinetobacter pittii]MBN6529041.1 NAD(+) diphosphatase [Acinetobacter pittii]MBN6535056.1 NAD(+) diphosphatase [Acinetobacter pittii]MDS7925978.1 NAD(+) diphosphatase [Acinetobacter sp. V115_6]OCY40742.1 NADH pyrophosphatase [Acinetobacter pittii]